VTPRFHRFLGISYPNSADLQRAKQLGITRPGGAIGIHGTKSNLAMVARAWLRLGNTLGLMQLWGPTDGCIGVANEDVEILYQAVKLGTRVTILP
jgi:murein L,D-transpeptidase YafK